jgi:pimeloyl-ACP methyl ester carboxylesterase
MPDRPLRDTAETRARSGPRTIKIAGIALERHGRGQPPLLLIHGLGGGRSHWRPLIDRLAASHDLLVVDLPGHGDSDPPDHRASLSAAGYARRLARLLDELGLAAAHVAGHSLGGWTALELAKLGRARSVVALAPAGLWPGTAPWRTRLILSSQYRVGRIAAPLLPPILRTAIGRRLVLGTVIARPSQMPADAAVEIVSTYLSTRRLRRHLAALSRERFLDGRSIHVPVTLIWGDRDRLLPRSARRRDQLPGHTQSTTLPGCGHLSAWDDPSLVAEAILAVTTAPQSWSAISAATGW